MPQPLPQGLYEQLLDEELQERIAATPELKAILRQHGLLTRDPRAVERKKYGRMKARKRFQYSKR